MSYSTIEGCIRQSNKEPIMTDTNSREPRHDEDDYPTIRVERSLSHAIGINRFLIEQLQKAKAPQATLALKIADHLANARKDFHVVLNDQRDQ
jgi:hypothetical protein